MSDPAHLLSLSDNAVKRVSFLMTQEENPDVMLRVVVDGGGCAGFQYGFSFDNIKTDDDVIVEQDGVKLVTDNMSLMYLAGSQVDFVEDMIGAAFSIKNPNAASTCSCGTSFSVA
jgi:iron-sulfur cluster insertion protein